MMLCFLKINVKTFFLPPKGLEFSYTQSPSYMQGAVMGAFLATNGLGSYLSSAIIAIVGVITKDGSCAAEFCNYSKVELFFWSFQLKNYLFACNACTLNK